MKLAGLGAPVYVAAPRDVEKIFQSVRDIARITDCEEQGRKLVAQMRERMDTINSRIRGLEPVRAFFITWLDPLWPRGKTPSRRCAAMWGVSISADFPQYYPVTASSRFS